MWKLATVQNGGKVPRWAMHRADTMISLLQNWYELEAFSPVCLALDSLSFLCVLCSISIRSHPRALNPVYGLWSCGPASLKSSFVWKRHILIIHMVIGDSCCYTTVIDPPLLKYMAEETCPVGYWLNRKEA